MAWVDGKQFLFAIDAFFCIEKGFFELFVGVPAQRRVEKAVLECLPEAHGAMTCDVSLGKLQGLARSKVISFASGASGNVITSVTDYVTKISQRAKPDWDGADSSFIVNVRERCMHFFVDPNPPASAASALGGSANCNVVRDYFARKKAAKASGVVLTYDQFNPLIDFGRCLSDAERKVATKWVNDILGSVARSSATSSENPPQKAKKAGKKSASAAAKPAVAGLNR